MEGEEITVLGGGEAWRWQEFAVHVTPVLDYSIRVLCARPYPGHKNGCPKFNKGNVACPPGAPLFDKYFDLHSPIFAVINEFDIGRHAEKLAERHPKWSDRQLRCCLYWQAGARKRLAEKIEKVLKLDCFNGYEATTCPEAMGVNVTETMRTVGVLLEWPPLNIARQIAMIGRRVDG